MKIGESAKTSKTSDSESIDKAQSKDQQPVVVTVAKESFGHRAARLVEYVGLGMPFAAMALTLVSDYDFASAFISVGVSVMIGGIVATAAQGCRQETPGVLRFLAPFTYMLGGVLLTGTGLLHLSNQHCLR